MVSVASGFRVVVWSQGWDGGNFFHSTSSKILVCLWYSLGTSTSWVNFPASLDSSMEIPLSKLSLSSSWNMALWWCSCFVRILQFWMTLAIIGLIWDFLQSIEQIMMGRKNVSMTASLHLNFGSKVESQEYPRIRSSPPKSVTRNLMISWHVPVQTYRSMQCVSTPALLVVPSIFQIFQGLSRSWLPRPSLFKSFRCMKLSVALESTKMFLSAVACKVLNEMGTFRERYLVIYRDLQPIALAQADGFECPKNPPSWRSPGLWCPLHPPPHLLVSPWFQNWIVSSSTSYFGWFFVVTIDFFDLWSASACVGAWVWGRSLRTITTKVSLLFTSETLAGSHKFSPFICIYLPGPDPIRGSVHTIGVFSPFTFPGRLPLFCCLGLLLLFQVS